MRIMESLGYVKKSRLEEAIKKYEAWEKKLADLEIKKKDRERKSIRIHGREKMGVFQGNTGTLYTIFCVTLLSTGTAERRQLVLAITGSKPIRQCTPIFRQPIHGVKCVIFKLPTNMMLF